MKDSTLYLLTGAAGNLGSSVSRELVAQGKQVRALVLKSDPAAERVPKEVEIVIGDIVDNDSLESFFTVENGIESIVIHCASIVTVNPEYNKKVYEVNVNGTRNIIDKCLEHKVKKLVYISSVGAIPEPPKDRPVREVALFDPDSVVGYYGKTKAEATQIVLDAVNQKGLDASIVFPTGICGPYDYAYGYYANFIIDSVKGKMPAGIAGSFNAVDVRDLAKGVIACADKGRKGEGYIMGNQTVTIRELFQAVSKTAGTAEIKLMLPLGIANLIAALFEVISKFTKKPPFFTRFSVYNLARNNNYSSEKAKRELDYHVRPFEETIADEVEWLKSEGKI
jgi:dihydroflavonol-4-reductase